MNLLASSMCFAGAGHSGHSEPTSTKSGEELARRRFFTGPACQFMHIGREKVALGEALLMDLFNGLLMVYTLIKVLFQANIQQRYDRHVNNADRQSRA